MKPPQVVAETHCNVRSTRSLQWIVVALGLVALARTFLRLVPLFTSHAEFVPITTSGCEEEALFSIWKFVRGDAVYSDPSAIPYAVGYFNWFFYWCYGLVVKCSFAALHLETNWLPVITRAVTLCFAFGCVGMIYLIGRRADLWPSNWSQSAVLALAWLCIFNELIGGWIATTRPDVAAMFFDLSALLAGFYFLDRRGLRRLTVFVLGCYFAWACKHNMVAVLTGMCALLLILRRNRELSFVISASALLYWLTFLIGGKLYSFSILYSQKSCAFSIEQGWSVVRSAFDAAPQLAVVLLMLFLSVIYRGHLRCNPKQLFLGLSCGVPWVLALIGCAKHGADSNYFFEPSVLGVLWLLNVCEQLRARIGPERLLSGSVAVIVAAIAIVDVRILCGAVVGQDSLKRTINELRAGSRPCSNSESAHLGALLKKLRAPVLVTERRYNLPWIQTHEPHFVVAYMYSEDRARGRVYEGGGLGALIAAGYFQTIVTGAGVPNDANLTVAKVSAAHEIDGQSLDRYELQYSNARFRVYRIKPVKSDESTAAMTLDLAR